MGEAARKIVDEDSAVPNGGPASFPAVSAQYLGQGQLQPTNIAGRPAPKGRHLSPVNPADHDGSVAGDAEGNGTREGAETEVDGVAVMFGGEALRVLEKAAKVADKKEKKGEDPSVSIVGEMFKDPRTACKTFTEAIALVKKHMPSFLRFKIDELSFQKLAGNVVGKSVETGMIADPVILLYPPAKAATVLFHELSHDKNRIRNEALVHTNTLMHFEGIETPEEYDRAVEKCYRFAAIFGRGNIKKGAIEAYKLYYRAARDNNPKFFEELYRTFMRRALKPRHYFTQESAHAFFQQVFPELKISGMVAAQDGRDGHGGQQEKST